MDGSAMRRLAAVVLVVGLLSVQTACYHSIVERQPATGEPDLHESFEPAFVAGLVPAEVDASGTCEGAGWAKVETQYSFLNWVVGAVTLGIFTPMDIRVWCAD